MAGAAGVTAGDGQLFLCEHAAVQRGFQPVGLSLIPDVGEQHHRCAEHGAGVGVLSAPFAHHAGSRAVNGLKHRVPLAEVAAAGRAYAALKFGRFVGDDVAVKVGQHKHLEVGAALFVDELGGGDQSSVSMSGYSLPTS